MKFNFYLILLVCLSFTACKNQKNEKPELDAMTILSKATEKAGSLDKWNTLKEVKFGLNRKIFGENGAVEKNELHVYEFGERPKKRISFEGEEGAFVTYAEIVGQYFMFIDEKENTDFDEDSVSGEIKQSSLLSCVPFSIGKLEGQVKYLGTDSTEHNEITEVVAISDVQEKWWFYFSKMNGDLLSYKYFNKGSINQYFIEAKQVYGGIELPVYIRKFSIEGNDKVLQEHIFLGSRSLK
jgi:hypothetical protein